MRRCERVSAVYNGSTSMETDSRALFSLARALQPEHDQRLEHLRRAVENGTYPVSSMAVAAALMDAHTKSRPR